MSPVPQDRKVGTFQLLTFFGVPYQGLQPSQSTHQGLQTCKGSCGDQITYKTVGPLKTVLSIPTIVGCKGSVLYVQWPTGTQWPGQSRSSSWCCALCVLMRRKCRSVSAEHTANMQRRLRAALIFRS